jgi:transcription initiation factor TFIIIB Brf1 subunit/transcription initiation factor TFIIB
MQQLQEGFPVMAEPTCPHKRQRLIAKDDESQYVECLDCGAILEGEEIKNPSDFNESLSDA